MSAEISPLALRSHSASRPLWLRLRRSQPFTLTVLMCCLALLWMSPFLWMLATSFSATTFGEDMASLLPRMPLTLDNFRDAWDSANWLSLYANTLIFTFGTFFVQLLTITTAGAVPRAAADVLAVGAGLRHRQHYLPLERVSVAADDAERPGQTGADRGAGLVCHGR